jgi:hypothetical protein
MTKKILVNSGEKVEVLDNDMVEKLRDYVKTMPFKTIFTKSLSTMFGAMCPLVSSSAWKEIFDNLDYSFIEEQMMVNLAKKYNKDELYELMELSQKPLFKKLMVNVEDDMGRGQKIGQEWYVNNKEDLCKNIKFVFTKHQIDEETIDELIEEIKRS